MCAVGQHSDLINNGKPSSRVRRLSKGWCAQVPVRIFVTKQLPKTATGKIQRRMMVEHFIKGPGQEEEAGRGGSGKTPAQSHRSKL